MDFSPVHTVMMMENYRSTPQILAAANSLIDKKVQNKEGAPPYSLFSYYILLDISEFGYDSDLAFCEDLAREVGVGAVPGSSFFKEPVNHLIRFHFAKRDETLNGALNRLSDIRKKFPHHR